MSPSILRNPESFKNASGSEQIRAKNHAIIGLNLTITTNQRSDQKLSTVSDYATKARNRSPHPMKYPTKISNTSEISIPWLLRQIATSTWTFDISSYSERLRAIGATHRVETLEIEISDGCPYFQHFVAKPSKWAIFGVLINVEISRQIWGWGYDHEWSKRTNDTL